MAFDTENIQLSMRDTDTGKWLTANVYTMEGVNGPDGAPRQMSISQLLLAICLQRAAEVETGIIAIMEQMNANTETLEGLTVIEEKLVNGETNVGQMRRDDDGTPFRWVDEHTGETMESQTADAFLRGIGMTTYATLDVDSLYSEIESKMDTLNSISQELLIDLQSKTSKRDQCYDFASNGIKSFHTVLTGIVNNL